MSKILKKYEVKFQTTISEEIWTRQVVARSKCEAVIKIVHTYETVHIYDVAEVLRVRKVSNA